MSKKRPDAYHLAIEALSLADYLRNLKNDSRPIVARLSGIAKARAARRWAAWEAEKAKRIEQYVWLDYQWYDPILGISRRKGGA